MSYSVFTDLISKYAQEDQPMVDPMDLQVGQSVYDAEGNEMVVIGDPEDTTDKTLMPADQQGSNIPEGVTNVEDAELTSQYSLQPDSAQGPITARLAALRKQAAAFFRKAQAEDVSVNWDDLIDIAHEMNNAIQTKNMKRVMESLEDMTDMVLMNVQLPADITAGSSIFEEFIRDE